MAKKTPKLAVGTLVARIEQPSVRYRLTSKSDSYTFRALPYQARGPEQQLVVAGSHLIGDGSTWTVVS